jgi:hypothetical protein
MTQFDEKDQNGQKMLQTAHKLTLSPKELSKMGDIINYSPYKFFVGIATLLFVNIVLSELYSTILVAGLTQYSTLPSLQFYVRMLDGPEVQWLLASLAFAQTITPHEREQIAVYKKPLFGFNKNEILSDAYNSWIVALLDNCIPAVIYKGNILDLDPVVDLDTINQHRRGLMAQKTKELKNAYKTEPASHYAYLYTLGFEGLKGYSFLLSSLLTSISGPKGYGYFVLFTLCQLGGVTPAFAAFTSS